MREERIHPWLEPLQGAPCQEMWGDGGHKPTRDTQAEQPGTQGRLQAPDVVDVARDRGGDPDRETRRRRRVQGRRRKFDLLVENQAHRRAGTNAAAIASSQPAISAKPPLGAAMGNSGVPWSARSARSPENSARPTTRRWPRSGSGAGASRRRLPGRRVRGSRGRGRAGIARRSSGCRCRSHGRRRHSPPPRGDTGERPKGEEDAVDGAHAPRSRSRRATLARNSGTPRSSRLEVSRISG